MIGIDDNEFVRSEQLQSSERARRLPLFASREFSIDDEARNADLSTQEKLLDDEQFFVIDGQQRLQTFYIGLCGSYGGKVLYFDLYSDFQRGDYEFRFASPTRGKSSVKNLDRSEREIIRDFAVDEPHKCKHITANVKQFYRNIFDVKSVGISEIVVDYGRTLIENRQRMVELFRRLNSEGTPLNTLDLVASRLKGFDSRMENLRRSRRIMPIKFVRRSARCATSCAAQKTTFGLR